MRRVLQAAALVDQPRAIGLDHHAATIAEAERRAYEAGVADGVTQGHVAGLAEGRADRRATAAEVREAVDQLRALLAASQDDIAANVRDLSLRLAREVCAVGVTADGVALAERVTSALQRIDDAPLRVHVAPDEVTELGALLADELRSVELVPDPALGAGEARIVGPWSDADLRWDATWQTVEEVLAGD